MSNGLRDAHSEVKHALSSHIFHQSQRIEELIMLSLSNCLLIDKRFRFNNQEHVLHVQLLTSSFTFNMFIYLFSDKSTSWTHERAHVRHLFSLIKLLLDVLSSSLQTITEQPTPPLRFYTVV